MDNYSKDLQELKDKDKVNILRTPQGIFDAQIKAWDIIVKKLTDEDPFFKKVWESQKAWGKRVGYYSLLQHRRLQGGLRAPASASWGSRAC